MASPCSLDDEATVDAEHLPGDVARRLGRQEEEWPVEVPFLPEAAATGAESRDTSVPPRAGPPICAAEKPVWRSLKMRA